MRSADYERQKKAIRVSLETADGKVFETDLMLLQGETLQNTMNGHAQFLQLREADGTLTLTAKSFIRRITPVAAEEKPESAPLSDVNFHSEDPYLILNLPRHASDEEVRDAYHKLVRAYHPDKLASLELPPAILDYGEEVLKKINAAYEMVMFQRRKPGSAA